MLPPPALGVESCLPLPGPLTPCHQKEKTNKKKYLDDLSLLEKIDLKSTLIPYPKFIGPPNINETSGLYLPTENSILQHQLADLATFTTNHNMKLNLKKTKVISFDFSKKYNFLPQLSFPNCDPLEVIHETKLLGITITSDLNWSSHVQNICRRATKNLWVLQKKALAVIFGKDYDSYSIQEELKQTTGVCCQ